MLVYDLEEMEESINNEEEDKSIELQFGDSKYRVYFNYATKSKSKVFIREIEDIDCMRNNKEEVKIILSDTADSTVLFPGCEPIKYKILSDIIVDNYIE